MPVRAYLRERFMPHIWCPGCGHGTIMNNLVRAIDSLGLKKNEVVMVTGIGCSSRISGYLDFHTLHTIHGRALAFATGVKLARPELTLIVPMGDGDALAIGGNHFIHAARRNMDLTVVLVNNMIYGMTGGQVAPTTPIVATASTAPHGSYEETFNIPYLAESCGAVYVARWTSYHIRHLTKSIKEALMKKGFSLVEILAPCPTLYSRRNKLGDGLEQMEYYRDHSEIRNGADTKTVALEFQGKITVGKFVDKDRPTYLQAMAEHFQKRLGDRYVPSDELRNLLHAQDRN